MANNKLQRLQKYLELVNNKLSSPPTEKHAGHPEAYYDFWKREQKAVQKEVDMLITYGVKK